MRLSRGKKTATTGTRKKKGRDDLRGSDEGEEDVDGSEDEVKIRVPNRSMDGPPCVVCDGLGLRVRRAGWLQDKGGRRGLRVSREKRP